MKKTLYFALLLCVVACAQPKKTEIPLFNKASFETTIDGKPVSLYTLKSPNEGVVLQVTNFGGRIIALWTPDKDGTYEDIVLGYDNIDKYVNNQGERFLGTVVGRYANRIAKGEFEIDGVKYQLPINNNGQTLHGGLKGLDMVVWDVINATDNELVLRHVSPDGADGFPGNLTVDMVYTLTPDNELKITYKATTDKPTVVNLSHHSFFNLKGEGMGTILDHVLTINASKMIPVDSVLIPTGEIASVENTPFDFRKPTAIGDRINDDNEQLKLGRGYDHCWVIDRKAADDVEFAASVYEPTTGRVIEVWTDQPGIQFYSGNFFTGNATGKYGRALNYRESIALETQKFPDSPNQPNFPSTRLNPGEEYKQTCIYKFSVKQ